MAEALVTCVQRSMDGSWGRWTPGDAFSKMADRVLLAGCQDMAGVPLTTPTLELGRVRTLRSLHRPLQLRPAVLCCCPVVVSCTIAPYGHMDGCQSNVNKQILQQREKQTACDSSDPPVHAYCWLRL